jgi:hypothetical protein
MVEDEAAADDFEVSFEDGGAEMVEHGSRKCPSGRIMPLAKAFYQEIFGKRLLEL